MEGLQEAVPASGLTSSLRYEDGSGHQDHTGGRNSSVTPPRTGCLSTGGEPPGHWRKRARKTGVSRRPRHRRFLVYFALLATFVLCSSAPTAVFSALITPALAAPAAQNAPGNSTTAVAPPAPPVLQQVIAPGTVTQANTTPPLPTPASAFLPGIPLNITQVPGGIQVTASYGRFAVSNATSYVVRAYSGAIEYEAAGFTAVAPTGAVLLPSSASLVPLASGFESVYALASGKSFAGTMKVFYNFTETSDKITAIFVPSRGPSSEYSVLWLGFTNLSDVQTVNLAGEDTPFATVGQPGFYVARTARSLATSLGNLKEIGTLDDNLTTGTAGLSHQVRMDFSDSATLYNGSFANSNGSFSFGGLTGNVVAVSFVPGALVIDPQFIITTNYLGSVGVTGQRKMFYDGSIYWLFDYNSPSIEYWYSTQGSVNWVHAGLVPGETGFGAQSHMVSSLGFSVVHRGSTVNVLWVDTYNVNTGKTEGNSIILQAGGFISDTVGSPHITWLLSTAQLHFDVSTWTFIKYDGTTGNGVAIQTLDATYTPDGQLVTTYTTSVNGETQGYHVVVDRFGCEDPYCIVNSNYVEITDASFWVAETSTVVPPGNIESATTVAFQGLGGGTLTFYTDHSTTMWVYGQWTLYSGGLFYTIQSPSECWRGLSFPPSSWSGWPSSVSNTRGYFTAAPTGTQIELLLPLSTNNNYNGMVAYNFDQSFTQDIGYGACGFTQDTAASNRMTISQIPAEPTEMVSSTEWDGTSVDVLYVAGPTNNMYINHLRLIPGITALVDPAGSAVLPWSGSAYQGAADLNSIDTTSHFIVASFEVGLNPYYLYTFEVPIPSDVNAGPNDPWVQLPGGPSVQEGGSAVNPSSGILTYSMPLVNTPALGTTESLSLVYKEPGLWFGPASSPSIMSSSSPFDLGFSAYGFFEQSSMFLNLPWIDTSRQVLHMGGIYAFDIQWNTVTGNTRWFNNTRGIAFHLLLKVDVGYYYLYLADGTQIAFDYSIAGEPPGAIEDVWSPGGVRVLSFFYDASQRLWYVSTPPASGGHVRNVNAPEIALSYVGGSGKCPYEVSSIAYEHTASLPGKTVAFSYPVGAADCSQTPSQQMKVIDAVGRVTTFTLAYGKLTAVSLSSGGSLAFTYAQDLMWKGQDLYHDDDVFSLPVNNEWVNSSTNTILRQRQFNYAYEDQSVVENDVKTANSAGAWQGEVQYRFRSDQALSALRTIDDSGRVLNFDMQTLTGANMADLSGNGNNAAITGTAVTGGEFGKARSFSGSGNDYLLAASSSSLNIVSSFTITAWVNYATNTGTSTSTIVRKWDSAGSLGYLLDLFQSSASTPNLLRACIGNGATHCYTATGGALGSANTWYQVAVAYTVGTGLTFFVNGAAVSTITGIAYAPSTTTQSLAIGIPPDRLGVSTQAWHGAIDEVSVYSRPLSSNEIASLYNDNLVQVGMAQQWWAYNAQPHTTDTYVGYNLAAPAGTSSDYVDEWGNTIYKRDIYGNETFFSYNNTNYQESFYAPGRLLKTSTASLFSSGFDYGLAGTRLTLSQQVGTGYAAPDYSTVGRYAPSLALSGTASSSDVRLSDAFSTSDSTYALAMLNVALLSGATFYLNMTAGNTATAGVKMSGGSIYMHSYGTGWVWLLCTTTYAYSTMYALALEYNIATGYANLYVNGNRLVSSGHGPSCANARVNTYTLTGFTLESQGAATTWIDDVQVTASRYVTINGLSPGQVVEAVSADNTPIAIVQDAVGSAAVSFNFLLPVAGGPPWPWKSSGNARLLVYNIDGTLDYVSPRTDFAAGDSYTYVPSRTVSRLVEGRSGFDYYSTMVINQQSDTSGTMTCKDSSSQYATCALGWSSLWGVPTTGHGRSSHFLGLTEDDEGEWVSSTAPQSVTSNTLSSYLVSYMYVNTSNAASDMPIRVAVGANNSLVSGVNFQTAYWGEPYSGGNPNNVCSAATPPQDCPFWIGTTWSQKYMGNLNAVTPSNSVVKFIVKESDLFGTSPGNGQQMTQFYWQLSAGQGYFGGTSIGNSDSGSVTITGYSDSEYLNLYYANNDTAIPGARATPYSGTTVINLYPAVSVFPVRVVLKITGSNPQNILFASNAFTVWGGDSFAFKWISGGYPYANIPWYNTYLAYTANPTPSSSVHTGLLGQYTGQADCLDAALCYDMESILQSTQATAFDGTASLSNQMLDLSGHNNLGSPKSTGYATGLHNLAQSFDGQSSYIYVPESSSLQGQFLTISAWVKLNSLSSSAETIVDNSMPATAPNDGGYALWVVPNGTVEFGIYNSVQTAPFTVYSSTALSTGTWYHIAATFDGSANKVYVNGLLSRTAANTHAPSYSPPSGLEFTIGTCYQVWLFGSGCRWFNGAIGSVVVYGSALTATQVSGLFRSQLPNAQATYTHPLASGAIDRSHLLVNGNYVEREFSYDSYLDLLSSGLNGNTTTYAYSPLYNGAYRTQQQRPDEAQASKMEYTSYDISDGNVLGTMDTNGLVTRYTYDSSNRQTDAASYAPDSSELLGVDMETTFTAASGTWTFVDLSRQVYPTISTTSGLGTTSTVPGPNGVEGMAQSFGSSAYVDFPTPSTSGALMVSAWVRESTAQSAAIVARWGSTASTQAYQLSLTGGKPVFSVMSAALTTYTATSPSALSSGVWYLVTGVYDGANTITLYVNQTSVASTPGVGASLNGASTVHVRIGNGITAFIDDVRIYSKALAAPDIANLYAGTYGLLSSQTTARDDTAFPSITTYSPDSIPRSLFFDMSTMKSGQTNLLEDVSGNGANGLIGNGVTVGTSIPGEVGSGAQFSESQSGAAINAPSAFIFPTSDFTMSFWFNANTIPTNGAVWFAGATSAGFVECVGVYSYNGVLKGYLARADQYATLYYTPGWSVLTKTWTHVVYTFDGSTLRLYINGVQQGSGTSFPGPPCTATGSFQVGGAATMFSIDGYMDEFQVLPTALSGPQVTSLYNGYASGPTPYDVTHLSRIYFDGLGNANREVTTDLYGHIVMTQQTLAWNGQPLYAYLPNGQHYTYAYSFDGVGLTTTNPLGGVTTEIVFRGSGGVQVNTLDADGHESFSSVDLLGRPNYAGVYNPNAGSDTSLSAWNYTATTYNALNGRVGVATYRGSTRDWMFTTYYDSVGLVVMTVDPNGRTSNTTYDGDLRLATTSDVMGRVAIYSYASISGQPGYRMPMISSIGLKASAASLVCSACTETFSYDWVGNTLTIVNSTATITRAYDSLSRMSSEEFGVSGSSPMYVNYSYDTASRVTSISYPNGWGTAGYVFDTLGRASQVTFNGSEYVALSYDAYSRLAKLWYWPGGTNESEYQNYSYDALNRAMSTGIHGSNDAMQLTYTYDPASLVTSISDNIYPAGVSTPRTDSYAYDANGRLVTASGPFSNKPLVNNEDQMAYLNYSYDAYGFITQKQDSDFAAGTGRWNLAQTVLYTPSSSYFEAVASSSQAVTETFSYNSDGSMTGRSGWSFGFDYLQQMVSATGGTPAYTYSYAYDGVGRKVKEVDNEGATITLYDAYIGRDLAYQRDAYLNAGSIYVYLGGRVLFRLDQFLGYQPLYYATDLSGNVRADFHWRFARGQVFFAVDDMFRYKPLGEMATQYYWSNPLDPYSDYLRFSSTPLTGTGLYLMGARRYAPDLGRFLSRDQLGFHDYSYAAGNPISFRDPSGLAPEDYGGGGDVPPGDLLDPYGPPAPSGGDWYVSPEAAAAFSGMTGDWSVAGAMTPGEFTAADVEESLGLSVSPTSSPSPVSSAPDLSAPTPRLSANEPGVEPAANDKAGPKGSPSEPTQGTDIGQWKEDALKAQFSYNGQDYRFSEDSAQHVWDNGHLGQTMQKFGVNTNSEVLDLVGQTLDEGTLGTSTNPRYLAVEAEIGGGTLRVVLDPGAGVVVNFYPVG